MYVFRNSDYDQDIPQSQTADKPMTPQGKATQQSQDTRKTTKQCNQLSLPHQVDWFSPFNSLSAYI